ncbi:Long-chain-fatty-acid--CoA ligase FadD15 [Weeksella virosa]|mgnify:CR=1 FL=1|uniref:AMP-dependent synthetase/ligase n=1 Tax=Weeksella virosa TaxID=1014 RepID=UPI000DFA4A7A|nr:long-chain fatty acid--CoA ligase [Weeksella virosa]SUP54843.1 Long-chain-fatty-acid--CoA ligase FadD15 [Weeksella virosa]
MKITRLFDFLYNQLENNPIPDSLVSKVNGEWKKTSTQEYVNKANTFSRGLLKLGIKPQDKIGIVTANNRTEWNICDMGMQQVGVISVPLYPTLSPKDYEYVLSNSECKICIVSDKDLYDKVLQAKQNVPTLTGIYLFDDVAGLPNWQEILDLGADDSTQSEVEALKNLVKAQDIATIIYTSGTTGKPKGVVLSHENIVSNVLMSTPAVPNLPSPSRALSFLPINHILERMIVYLYLSRGIGIYYAESIDKLGDNLKEVKPHVFTVVPRVVEKVYDKIYTTGANAGGLKTKIFMWALSLAKEYQPFEKLGFMQKLKMKIADKLVFTKWREGVGGEVVCLVSGSAPLSAHLNRIFWGAGIPVLEGYGLSETSPVISVNMMKKNSFGIGTVGPVLKGIDVKFGEDGEILVKGPNVFKEYYNDPEKTSEAFTADGYFKTGDIGVLENGLLKITDRKKEMFKTSGGKYIAPQQIENLFKQSPYIEQIMVVGEGEKMPTAMIQPSFEKLKSFLKEDLSNEEMIKKPEVIARIQKEVDRMNRQLGHWEQVKKFELTSNEWSIETGELTPTLKLKRKIIMEKNKDLYNKLYDIKY